MCKFVFAGIILFFQAIYSEERPLTGLLQMQRQMDKKNISDISFIGSRLSPRSLKEDLL